MLSTHTGCRLHIRFCAIISCIFYVFDVIVSLVVSRNTTLVPSLGLRIGPAWQAGLSTGMQRERVPPRIIKKKEKEPASCIIIMEILHVIVMFPIVTFCANIYTELVYYWQIEVIL